MGINKVILSGKLAREPQLDYKPTGPVTQLDVVCTCGQMGADGKWNKSETTIPVLVKGKTAERIAGWFNAGMAVEVEGSLYGFSFGSAGRTAKGCAVLAHRVNKQGG
ncbi:hypothetical protein FACS1894216_02370 [Synergistales bacterium]|nr:hypothetical protein FACS1894216_02370 [Synergistales bacterium]